MWSYWQYDEWNQPAEEKTNVRTLSGKALKMKAEKSFSARVKDFSELKGSEYIMAWSLFIVCVHLAFYPFFEHTYFIFSFLLSLDAAFTWTCGKYWKSFPSTLGMACWLDLNWQIPSRGCKHIFWPHGDLQILQHESTTSRPHQTLRRKRWIRRQYRDLRSQFALKATVSDSCNCLLIIKNLAEQR